MPSIRQTLEAKQQSALAPSAPLSRQARGRDHAGPPARARSALQLVHPLAPRSAEHRR